MILIFDFWSYCLRKIKDQDPRSLPGSWSLILILFQVISAWDHLVANPSMDMKYVYSMDLWLQTCIKLIIVLKLWRKEVTLCSHFLYFNNFLREVHKCFPNLIVVRMFERRWMGGRFVGGESLKTIKIAKSLTPSYYSPFKSYPDPRSEGQNR